MKYRLVHSVTVVGFFFALVANTEFYSQAKKPNLTGTWKLDKSGGSYVKSKARYDLILIIEQDESLLKITRKLIQNGHEEVRGLNYNTDGRREEVRTIAGDWHGSGRTKWNGIKVVSKLLESVNDNIAASTFNVTQELSLSADGQTLTQKLMVRQTGIGTANAGSSAEAAIAEELARNVLNSLPEYEFVRVFQRVP